MTWDQKVRNLTSPGRRWYGRFMICSAPLSKAQPPRRAYLSELTDLRDQLKTALSERSQDPQAGVSDIAGRIKALKVKNTIEAAPAMAAKALATAEEPVTSQIRRNARGVPEGESGWRGRMTVEERRPGGRG